MVFIKIIKTIINAYKTINFRLYFAIFITKLLPTIYQTVRVYYLGDMPSDWGLNIASQLSWVGLFYEVVQEALILPLFPLLGCVLNDRYEFANRVRTGLIVVAGIYTLLSVIIVVAARPLVIFMAQADVLVNATVVYIRLETVSSLFATLWNFINLVLIQLCLDKFMYICLVVQLILSVLLDTFLISNLSVSAKIGVNGIAITNITVNAILLVMTLTLLATRANLPIFQRVESTTTSSSSYFDFRWLKSWFHVGKYSGLESFLRNFSFMMMIIRMVNSISQQGSYWVANNFIWQWLLLPSLALADLVKKEISEDEINIHRKTLGYILLVTLFGMLWVISIPVWKPFLRYAMNVEAYETVYGIAILQTGFYLTFIFNSTIFDSTFYGLGKTSYMLIQSICIDGFYYGLMFILYKTDVFVPTLNRISLMFGIGMALDFIPTLVLYVIILKKKKLTIDYRFQDSDQIKLIPTNCNDIIIDSPLSTSSPSPSISPSSSPILKDEPSISTFNE